MGAGRGTGVTPEDVTTPADRKLTRLIFNTSLGFNAISLSDTPVRSIYPGATCGESA